MTDAEDPDPTRDWHPAENLDAVGVYESGWWLRALELAAERLHVPPEGTIGPEQQVDARFFVLALERFRTTIVKIAAPQLSDAAQGQATVALAAFDQVAGREAISQARNVTDAQRRVPGGKRIRSEAHPSAGENGRGTVYAVRDGHRLSPRRHRARRIRELAERPHVPRRRCRCSRPRTVLGHVLTGARNRATHRVAQARNDGTAKPTISRKVHRGTPRSSCVGAVGHDAAQPMEGLHDGH